MDKRMLMDQKLKEFLPTYRIYFQPPNGLELETPCCVYTFEDQRPIGADNVKYARFETYNIKLIVKTELEPAVGILMRSPGFRFLTSYPSGILTHFVFKYTL